MLSPRCKLKSNVVLLCFVINAFVCVQVYKYVNSATEMEEATPEVTEKDKPEDVADVRQEWRRYQATSSVEVDSSNIVTQWWWPWAEQYKKSEPLSGEPDSPLVIASWTMKQPGKWKWFNDRTFSRCSALYPWMKCVYKYGLSNQQLAQTDAILFHARHLRNETDLPTFERPSHQKWIFYETEPPTNVWPYVSRDWTGVWDNFNLSATYMWDADVTNHHHRFKCTPVSNGNRDVPPVRRRKKRDVAWFVSHCETPSRREVYVEELRKHMEVDVFGRCGRRSTCETFSASNKKALKCLTDFVNSTYKFYLSFENAFCQEYVTEKLHYYINLDVVPIVLGSYDYTGLLPPGTYIDVRNFTSPRALAEYVKRVASSDALYDEYIARKRRYSCSRKAYRAFYCLLCEYLHTHRLQRQTLNDAALHWSERTRCSSPHQFYRHIADDVISRLIEGNVSDVAAV